MKATGASALFGVMIDGKSDLFSVGHPACGLPHNEFGNTPVDQPAPIATAGGAGNLTGTFQWRFAYGKNDGRTTSPGPWSDQNTTTPVGTPTLDDATFGGLYGIVGPTPVYEVEIDGTTGPDTFKWREGSGPWTATVAITGSAQALGPNGVTVTFGATTGHAIGDKWQRTSGLVLLAQEADLSAIGLSSVSDLRVIERTADGGKTAAIVGRIYDGMTTTDFTDNVEKPDYSKSLPEFSSFGVNYGLEFLEPDSFDIEPDFTVLPVMALRGTAGPPRSIPGPIKLAGGEKADIRPVDMFPLLLCGAGEPDTITQVADEPTVIYDWSATSAKRNPRSISAFAYVGSPQVLPFFMYQMVMEELVIDFSGGKIDGITPKLLAANYGTSAPSQQVSGSGTWTGGFVAFGQRYDPKALTDDVYIKITQALAANTLKFKSKVGAAASYGATEYTIYVNATSNKQTKGGSQYNDEVELYDEAGLRLGADVGSNRQPYTLLAAAPFDANIQVDDEFVIPRTLAIPGRGSAPYTGSPAHFRTGPRFTDAHVTLYKNGAAIECQSGSITITTPKRGVVSLGAGARTLQDIPNEGFFAVKVELQRFIDSEEYRQIIRTDDRMIMVVALEGERIPINPGSVSTHREGLTFTMPQMRLTSVKSPVPGQVLIVESIEAEAEQPDNTGLDLFTAQLKTRAGWVYPS